MIPLSKNMNARFVRASLLLKFNNWPPRPTSPRKNVENRRRWQKLPVVLMDPSDVTLLGWVHTDKPSSVESTPKKKRCSYSSPKSSKRKHSSKPTSEDLKSLDDKWSERFSWLEALLLSKSFAVPVEPVRPSTVQLPVLCLPVWSLREPVPVLYKPPV